MIVRPIKTRVFREGEDLFAFITGYFKKLPEKSVVVITSKIVSLAEKRTAAFESVEFKRKLIRKEGDFVMPSKYGWLTVRDGVVMTSAGIDESNADGKLVLLPKDGFKTAHILRNKLRKKYGVKNLGVLITDSRRMPFRAGAVGVAIGYAGFCGIREYRGKPDIFGRKFKFSQMNVADSLAGAAVLVMGEGDERQPLAILKKTPVEFCDKIHPKELQIDIKDDMFCPLFLKLPYAKKDKKRK